MHLPRLEELEPLFRGKQAPSAFSDLVIKVISHCEKLEDASPFEVLVKMLEEEKASIPPSGSYDAIIIGGGVSGAAVLTGIGKKRRVLVIEKNRWPSVFGNLGSFFLNTNLQTLRSTPDNLNICFLNNIFCLPGQKPEALFIGKSLVGSLVSSGADILLNTEVTQVTHSTKSSMGTYEVLTKDGRSYFSSQVIVAIGRQGVNLTDFDLESQALIAKELAQTRGRIQSTEMFLENLREDPGYPTQFARQEVAIVGGGDGGGTLAMGLFGYFPGNLRNKSKIPAQREKILQSPDLFPRIHWVGRTKTQSQGGSYFRQGKPESLLSEHVSHFNFYSGKVRKVEWIQERGKWRLLGGRNASGEEVPLEVDQVLLATGYTKVLDSWMSQDLQKSFDHPDSGLYLIGAATLFQGGQKKKAIQFLPVLDQEGIALGERIRQTLEALPKAPGSKAVQTQSILEKYRKRLFYLVSVLNEID